MNDKWVWAAGAVAALVVFGVSRMNKSLLQIIQDFEGWSAAPYRDTAGILTIGYGHKIQTGETFTTLTKAQGVALLQKDLDRIAAQILPAITVRISENEKNALLSFAYNVGPTAFKNSTLLKKLNAGDRDGAAAELLKWNKARDAKTQLLVVVPGLTARRQAEQSLFLTA